MPIQNVNSANNSIQTTSVDSPQNQQNNQVNVRYTEKNSKDGDKLVISRQAEKLQTASRPENIDIERVSKKNENNFDSKTVAKPKKNENVSVNNQRNEQKITEERIIENIDENIKNKKQVEKNVNAERNSKKQSSSLDLTV